MAPPSVMFLAPGKPLTRIARGIFTRCGLLLVERQTFDDVERTLAQHWSPDCLVVDIHAVGGHDRQTALAALCALVERHVGGCGVSTRVVVATAAPLHGDEAKRCAALGIDVIAASETPYRRVARRIMDLVGRNGAACCPSASERTDFDGRRR